MVTLHGGFSHGHGAQVFLKPSEALLHGVELPSGDDLADFFDLSGRGGCGGCLWHG